MYSQSADYFIMILAGILSENVGLRTPLKLQEQYQTFLTSSVTLLLLTGTLVI